MTPYLDAWSLAALDALPLSVVVVDVRAADHPIVFVNAAFCALTGFTPAEVIGRDFLARAPAEDPARASLVRALGTDQGGEVTIVDHRKDGTPFRNRLVLSPLRDADGTVTHVLATGREVSVPDDRGRADAELLALLADATHDAIWDLDVASGRVEVNGRHRALFGVGRDYPWDYACWRGRVAPDQVEHIEKALTGAIADPQCHAHEHVYRVRSATGTRWVKDRFVILRDAAGRAVRVLGAMADVTAEHAPSEESPRDSAQHYRRLLDLAFEAVNVYDEHRTRVFRNATGNAIAARHGITDGLDNIHPDDAEAARTLLDRVFAERGASFDFTWRARGTDGWRTLEVRASNQLEDPAVRGVVMHWRDVTERVTHEHERREAEARERRLHDLFETAEDVTQIGGWELDLSTQTLQWTPGTHHIHETTPETYAPNVATAVDFYTGPSREAINRAVARAMEDGTSYSLDLELVTARGRRVPVRTTGRAELRAGKVVRLYGAIQDITAEVRAREALRRQAAVLDQIRDAIVLLDLEGRVVAWNDGATRLYGQPIAAVLGRRRDLWEPGSASCERAEAAAAQGEQLTFDAKVRRGDVTVEVRVATSPFLDETGQRVGLIALVQDVTETKRLHTQLEVAQRMEAVGMLAGGVAHDFNNLLTVVQGNADDVLEDAGLPVAARARIQEIREAARRAATLTRQLLAFGRRQELTPVQLELSALVRDTGRLLSRLVGEHITVAQEVGTTDAWVEADRSQLEQVLLNLAINARDAMPSGGRLAVGVELTRLRGEVAELPAGEYCALVVRDTGVGMDEETQQRIFEPFFTTKDASRGTGLGLATVYGIVRQSGGAVVVESAPGAGSTFRVLLPRTAGPAATAAPNETLRPSPREAPPVRETILLVEDDASVRRVCRRVLERQGYSILEASQPSEALRIAETRPHGIALVLTDIVMPGMSGAELVQHLRKTHPEIRYLLISGYTEDMDQLRAAIDDGMTFLPKPFTPDALTRAVRAVLAGAEA